MRCDKDFDKATSLELLISLFMSKKFYANGTYTYEKLSQKISILLCLFQLFTRTNKKNIGELAGRTLKYLYKTTSEEFRWKAPDDFFSNSVNMSSNFHNLRADDLFNHKLGNINCNANYSESRFGCYSQEFSKVSETQGLSLGYCRLLDGEKMEIDSKKILKTSWFENNTGELMGAFLHVHVQDSKNPFGINLVLPPLEKPQENYLDFPFPCVSLVKKEKIGKEKKKVGVPWENISEELKKNRNMFEYAPEKRKKYRMWEMHDGKRFKVQGILTDMNQDYEKKLQKDLDSSYQPAWKALSMQEFLRNVKNLILGVPNKLYALSKRKIRSRFRLESHSHQLTLNFLQEIINTAQAYQCLSSLAIEMEHKNELISPAFARGLKEILAFFENYVINVPESITIIQFSIQTESLRDQIRCLSVVCKELPSGLQLLDYLYDIITKNEGDFENCHLLQMLFKNSMRPILRILTEFVYNCEISSVNSEFFIQNDANIGIGEDFIPAKYETAYKFLPNFLFSPVSESILGLGKNLRVLKILEENLAVYYQILSTAKVSSISTEEIHVPIFKISYTTEKVNNLLDNFIAFQVEQTEKLLELERHELELEQQQADLLSEKKKQSVHNIKLVSAVKLKNEQEKIQEIKEKQSVFYNILQKQLRENNDIKRVEEAKRRSEELKAKEKLEKEQRELVEMGKKFLLDQHQEMLNKLYSKRELEIWQKKREDLSEKRRIFFADSEKLLTKNLENMMDIEEFPIILNEEEPFYEETQMKIDIPIEPNWLVSRVKQPPGGTSTVGELFNYKFEEEVQKAEVIQKRHGYREDLETLEICSSLLWEEILNKVFRKITPKKTWEIPAKPEDSDVFNDLFENFSEKKNQSKNLSLPFPKIIEKLIFEPIRVQADMVNKACVHLFVRKLKLISHLKALKRYALLEAGDTMDLFLNTIFSSSFTGNMTAAWEGSLKMSSSRDDEYGEFFQIHIRRNSLYRMQFATVDDIDFLVVQYNLTGPLQLIISPDRVAQYSKAFCALLRVKYVTSLLSNIKAFSVPRSHHFYRKIHLLRQKMQHFLDIYQGYIASELHGSSWKFLTKSIGKAQSLDQLIQVHKQYLDMIMSRCFLTDKGQVVMNQLDAIFKLVMKFRNMVLDYESCSAFEFERFEQDFNSIHRFAFKMTQAMAVKGNYPELFVRLDFNEFMTKKIQKEMEDN